MTSLKAVCFGLAAGSVAALSWSSAADAQGAYPNQTVRMVVPFSAGSITDGLARIVVDKLSEQWKQQVIVENRPGLPGTLSVARAAPDGYTLMLTSNGHTIAGVINKNLQFDPVKDFTGVSQVAVVPFVLIVPPDSDVKDITQLVTAAKAKPGQLNYSSAGVTSASFLAAEIFKQAAQVEMQHVPYKGAPEATTAVVRGDAAVYFGTPVPAAQELGAANKVRVIGVTSPKRVTQLPNVPTVAESGVPSFKYETWFGVLAPAGTPKPILDKVADGIKAALAMPDVAAKLTAQGSVPAPTTPDEFSTILKDDTERYSKILIDAGVGK